MQAKLGGRSLGRQLFVPETAYTRRCPRVARKNHVSVQARPSEAVEGFEANTQTVEYGSDTSEWSLHGQAQHKVAAKQFVRTKPRQARWPTPESASAWMSEFMWEGPSVGSVLGSCQLSSVVHGCASIRGHAKPDMQDRHVTVPNWQARDGRDDGDESIGCVAAQLPCSLAAVFDGHSGSRSARYSQGRLTGLLARNSQLWAALEQVVHPSGPRPASVASVAGALRGAFLQLDREILDEDRHKPPGEFDGTTALMGLQVGEHLFVANVGDSRAVLGRAGVAIRLSRDHTPDIPDERKRVESVGGHVRQHRGVWRLVLPLGPGCGLKICAVSRALGDIDYKEPRPLMTAVPDVSHWPLQPSTDRFVIYASDGLWGVVTDQQAVNCVEQVLNQMQGVCSPAHCADLAAHALKVFALEMGSYDDITVVVAVLQWAGTN